LRRRRGISEASGATPSFGPGITGFDLDVHKVFQMPWKESHRLQFRFEAFNALNHPNWACRT
jgi:hypothetical protein